MYSGPFGECYKIDTETGTKTNKKGIYIEGSMRTCNSIVENQREWMTKTNGDRKQLKNYKHYTNSDS